MPEAWKQALFDWHQLERTARAASAAEHAVDCGLSIVQAALCRVLFEQGEYHHDPASETTRSVLVESSRRMAAELGCSLGGLQRAQRRLVRIGVLRSEPLGQNGTRFTLSWARFWALRPALVDDLPPPQVTARERACMQVSARDRARAGEEKGNITSSSPLSKKETAPVPEPDPEPVLEPTSAVEEGAVTRGHARSPGEWRDDPGEWRNDPGEWRDDPVVAGVPELEAAADVQIAPLEPGSLRYGVWSPLCDDNLASGELATWHARQLSTAEPVVGDSEAELLLVLAAGLYASKLPIERVRRNRVALFCWIVRRGDWRRVLRYVPEATRLLEEFRRERARAPPAADSAG